MDNAEKGIACFWSSWIILDGKTSNPRRFRVPFVFLSFYHRFPINVCIRGCVVFYDGGTRTTWLFILWIFHAIIIQGKNRRYRFVQREDIFFFHYVKKIIIKLWFDRTGGSSDWHENVVDSSLSYIVFPRKMKPNTSRPNRYMKYWLTETNVMLCAFTTLYVLRFLDTLFGINCNGVGIPISYGKKLYQLSIY